MFEAYRVLKPFRWRGWHYGPEGKHIKQEVNQETGQPMACECSHYAGHIWVVEEGHPRKGWAIEQRKVVGDLTLRPDKYATDDEWIAARDDLKILTAPPRETEDEAYIPPQQRRVKAIAGVQ